MEISRLNETTILIGAIDPVVAEILRRIIPSADPGDSAAAKARLFSPPTEDRKEGPFVRDWEEYVEPELQKFFQSSLDVIAGDLKKMHADPVTGEATLAIPHDHLEAWVHGLNQARIVLVERHKLSEEDLHHQPLSPNDPRAIMAIQLDLYLTIQELFLRFLDGRRPSRGDSLPGDL